MFFLPILHDSQLSKCTSRLPLGTQNKHYLLHHVVYMGLAGTLRILGYWHTTMERNNQCCGLASFSRGPWEFTFHCFRADVRGNIHKTRNSYTTVSAQGHLLRDPDTKIRQTDVCYYLGANQGPPVNLVNITFATEKNTHEEGRHGKWLWYRIRIMHELDCLRPLVPAFTSSWLHSASCTT
ncbi:uncharacterized protein B0I36DRAFT_95032 [Microdochium trichocladiopsis]|uniref:Uncharacterized protein n=1 Tax=Microdochium trichocladiopsis TaxID=1682393 RepID=A0A9P8YC33_9PEZI|nr:uncharacterized protein B0I36DRAFT_95032 [Microdochium trichocladiopsis]KAH7035646.1 hypothetical protein B0I36DRAFT_95032 [Microdochium trichocladiopsis]